VGRFVVFACPNECLYRSLAKTIVVNEVGAKNQGPSFVDRHQRRLGVARDIKRIGLVLGDC
jgi:hypothetical protein